MSPGPIQREPPAGGASHREATSGENAPYRLTLLGAWDLTAQDGRSVRSVLAQPKRLCLLAYLALRAEPVARATVVAVFWPESSEERGRNALSQALHYLRRSLGPGVIQNVEGDRLYIPPSRLSFDARDLLHDAATHLERSGGTFLEGWNADDSQPLQEWLDTVRRRIADAHRDSAGDHPASAEPPLEAGVATAPSPAPLPPQSPPQLPARRPTDSPPPSGRVASASWARLPHRRAAVLVGTLLAVAVTTVAILAATRPRVLDAPSSRAAIVVLMPRLMSVEPEHRLRQDAVQVELVNHLVERIGAGRVVSAPFATTLRELEIILAAQADRDVPILVVETVVRVIRADVRLTATLLAWDGYGVVQSAISTDFVLDNAAAGLIEVPRAIGASVADEFAPLLAPSGH